MKAQIQELEAAVGKKARELESLHCVVPSNGSPISSPLSEDTSIREQLEVMRCSTPDHGQRETPSPVPLPLEELQRLQEKLQRLCRAEESALKRVADLEMELCSMHHREEEVAAERDVLQRQTEEQLLKISSLQARLDEQRRAVDSAHWLAVSELRSELLERTDEIHSLRDACDASHKEVKELRNLLEQARQQAAVQETEMMSLLERVQSNSQEHVDQHTVTNTEEGAVSVMDALLADAREEHCSLQEELVHLKKKCRQLQWLLSCHQNLSLTPHQQQQLSTLLQEVTLSPQSSDLESDEQPGKWPNNLYPQQPRLVAEEVFREAPELSLSYSLPDAFQEQIPGPASEVQQSRTDKDQQLKELREQCALLQNLKQENCELIQQVAELHNSCAALKNLQAENVVLMQEVEALKAKCTAVQQEKSVLEQQIKDLTAQCASVDSVQQEKYLLLEEIKALTCKCSLSENFKLENVALAKQVEELQSKYVALEVVQAENALLLEEVDKLRHECSASKKIEEENSKISKQAEILQTECLRLRNSEQEKISLVEKINCLNAKCLVVDCLEEENVSQAQKIVELQDLCSNLDNLQEENRVLSKKVGKLTDECFTMKKLQEENVCLSREVKDLREQCCIAKNLQLENLSMSQKVKDLETQCSIVNDLQEENKLLLQKIQKLQDEFLLLKKLQEENRSLAQTIEELQNGGSFVKKLQEENLSLCQRVKDLHAECAVTGGNMSHENAVLTQKLEELEAQCLLVAELQKDNASLLQQVHELSIKCKFLEKSHYEDDIQAVLSAHQDQEQNILKLQEEKKMLQEAYLKVLQDMDNKQGSLDELSGQLQRELEESEKLDLSLLERLTSSDEDVPAVEMLEPTLVIILRKILGSGISVLTFKELSLLHQHVCSATAAVMVQDDSRQSQMVVCDSLDPQARSKVSQLESLLSRERHLVSELRSALNSERLHAQELANHVRLQSQLLADMQIQQTSIQSSIGRYTDLIEIERNKTLTLEDKLASERSSNRQLQSALEGEKQKIRSIRIQDCSLLESMRQQLDMALENKGKLHHQLQQGTLETNAALQLRCTELEARVLQLEEELSQQREAAVHHKQVDTEKSAAILLGQLEAVEANLLSLIRESVHEDDDSDRDLRQRITGLKERLQELSTAHIPDNLEERLAPLRQREQHLLEELGAAQRQAGELRTALVVRDQRLAASKNQLATLGKELSASRSREAELERKLTLEGSCKSQGCLVSTLLHDEGIREGGVKAVRAGRGREDTVVLTAATVAHSAGFTARPERPTCSQGSIADAANGTDSKETEWLQEQIKVLQEREKINHAAWRDQKAALEEALAAARSHSHMSNGEPLQLSHDMEERMTHLFGKYLRSESYRKSLVWQKKYLLVALSGYQDCQATTLSQLALIAGHMPTKTRPSPRRRFRVAVVTVIVIQRMRYLVHRWRHSRRIGKSVIVSRPFCECVGPGTHLSYYATRKKWGQSPQYPPSRDEGALWHSSGYHRPWRLGENGCVTLLEPSSVAQYAVRCDNLQRQLGLATST